MFEQIGKFSIPTYAVCYLEYGDSEGLSSDDIENIDDWVKSFSEHQSLVFDYDRDDDGDTLDASFNTNPDYGLACDTLDAEVWGHAIS